MKNMRTFDELRQRVVTTNRKMRIAAVRPIDAASHDALQQITDEGLGEVLNVDGETAEAAAAKAVAMVRVGKADVLMKGLIGTDILLRAILDKENGLIAHQPVMAAEQPQTDTRRPVLTHISVAELPTYNRLLFFSDAAVIPYPTQEQRIAQVSYMTTVCHALGIDEPHIALIHCSEKASKKFPFVDGYKDIIEMAEKGKFGRCIIDGPLDVKSACSMEALKAKGIRSPLEGKADALIMPDIEAGNAFYKAMTLFANARTAGMLCGAIAPVVVPSRGDDAEAKFNSILLACAVGGK